MPKHLNGTNRRPRRPNRFPSQKKARKILRDDKVSGKKLTVRQRGFFGVIAGGGIPRRVVRRK